MKTRRKFQERTKEISPSVGSFKIRGFKKSRRGFALSGPSPDVPVGM
jgi:hypothetical protein